MISTMEESEENSNKKFEQEVGDKSRRKLKGRRQNKRGMWYGIGMFGLVGWSVAIPALLFLALGLWIDRHYQGPYSWTLMLLVVGVAVGCLNAWYWVKEEGKQIK